MRWQAVGANGRDQTILPTVPHCSLPRHGLPNSPMHCMHTFPVAGVSNDAVLNLAAASRILVHPQMRTWQRPVLCLWGRMRPPSQAVKKTFRHSTTRKWHG